MRDSAGIGESQTFDRSWLSSLCRTRSVLDSEKFITIWWQNRYVQSFGYNDYHNTVFNRDNDQSIQ